MMAMRKEQNQGIHPGSFEKACVNDNEDEDEDDEDNHFIISLEDNGEEDGLLCSPEDISFSTSDKQTLGVSSDVTKQLGEERTTSRYTNRSDLGAHVHNNFDNYNRQIFTFPTSLVSKDQITLNNSELDKCSSSHFSSTCVEPESSSIPTSNSNNDSSRPRKSIQLVNPPPPALCYISDYTAGKSNDRTSESAQVNDGESHKANKKTDCNSWASDPLNSQSVENSKLDGLTPKKSLVSNNFSSSDMGLETIKLGAESGGIWSEAIFLSRTHNGPHDIYPFSNSNTSECGGEKIDPRKPSNLDTGINVQTVYSSGPITVLQNCSSLYSLPALCSFKPLDSLSSSSATLSSQPASCVPRLSGPYPRIDKHQGLLSGPISSTGDVPESSLPEASTDSTKHTAADDSAGCTCIMCYRSSCPNTPDPKNFVIDLEKGDGVFDAKVGTNNKRKRSPVLQKARKRKEAKKFIDIYVLPQETNANNQVQLKINGSSNSDWQSKILGNNLTRESPSLLASPIIGPCTSKASPALPFNALCMKSSLVLSRTLPSSQRTTDAQVSASFPRSLDAQKIAQGKQMNVIQSVKRPIAPKVFVSLSEVLGKDETSCAADLSCSVATHHVGTSITSSNKSIPSTEKTFVSSSLATLRSLNLKYLHEEAVHNPSKEVDGKCITSTEQPSQWCASQPEADTSVKVNPTLISDTEASRGLGEAEGPPVIVLKDHAHLQILNDILKGRQLEMCSADNISELLRDSKALKAPVSNNKINSPKITVLTEPPREPIYAKSLLSPKVSTSKASTDFTMHYHHTASSTTTISVQRSVPSISAAAPIPHVSLPPKCTFVSSFQRQSCIGNKNLVYSLLKDNFQKAGPTNSSQMVALSNKLPPEKEASHLDRDLKVVSSNLKDENCGTPSYENESFGSSCNTPTPHPPEERLPNSYIEDWVNQAKTYTCETLQQEPRTQGSDLISDKSKPLYEEVASIHNYTRRASSVERQSNLTTEVNNDDGTRTTLILPVVTKLKPTPQTPTNLGLSSTPGIVSEEVLLSHTVPSAGIQKPAKLYSFINRTNESSSLTQSSPVGERIDAAVDNTLLSPSDSIDCVQNSDSLSPTKVAKSNAFNRCLTGGRSRLLSQSRKRNTVFKSSLEPRRTTSSTVVPSSNGIKLKIRFDAFHKKSQKTLDPLIGKVVESASDTSVLENEHWNKDNERNIKDGEIMSTAPKPTIVETLGNERVETAEEMFQRFQKQAMQEVFKAQLGVGNLSRNLRPARTSLAFLDKPSWRSSLEYSKKKKREEDKTSNPISKTDDASSTISAFSKDSGDKGLLGGNKKRHLSEDGSVSVKQARLSIKDYPKLKEDDSITSKKKVVCSNILAGHQVFVKFNTYENIHTGRSFLVPFFNIGGTRTQFDVEDMEYISRAVVDYEKEEKSCARHLLFHAREGNKASFLRKENYHHSSKITEKNYKKSSFVLEGFQRHAPRQAEPVVERWTVDSAVDIEIDRAEVDPDEEEHFASMIESRCSQLEEVSGNGFVTPEEAISKSKDNVTSGIEIDIAEGDSNAEKEFASQMASRATYNVDNDKITHLPLGNQLEPLSSSNGVSLSSHPHSLMRNRLEFLNSSNGFSQSRYPLILKRKMPPIHNVLKDLVSSTHQDSQELSRSNSHTVEAKSISNKEPENIRPVLSDNILSPSEDRGIRGVLQEANCSLTANQNSVVIKTEVPDTGYGDMSSVEPPPATPESMVKPGAPCVPLVKDEPIDEYFETLSTLVTRRQVVHDTASIQSTSDVVNSKDLTNLLEPRESNNPLAPMALASKVQLVSSPMSTEQVVSQSLNIPFDNVNKITLLEPTAAVFPDVPSISSISDNNLRGKTNTTIDISVKSSTGTENGTVVNDTETTLNNKPMSVVSHENLESLLVTDGGERADQLENITTPIRKIFNVAESPLDTESTVTADEMGSPKSPLPSSSISESSEVSSFSDTEDPVADELSQIQTMSHSQCPSPDKQNPVQSKITSLVESLRQRLTQQTPSLPSWLSTDKVPRVRSKIKMRSKEKSRKTTLNPKENIDVPVAKDPLSMEPPSVQSSVTCEKGTKFLHSPVSVIPTVESIQNPAIKSMLLESSSPASTLLPQAGPQLNELLLPNSSSEPHFSKHSPFGTPSCIETLQPNAVPSVTRPSSAEHNTEDVSTETMNLPVITPGETKTQPDSESPSVQECLLSKEVEYFSKVQPLPSMPASISCEAPNSQPTFPQNGTFSVVHPNHASSSYILPTATSSMGHISQTSSFDALPLRHGKNNVEDKNCMNDSKQISLPCPPVPSLTLDSNRSTPSDFEIEVGTEDNFEDDGKFRPIQPKLRKLSWKDYAAPYSRLVPTSLSDSPPMSPWGLPSGGPSTSATFNQDQQKALLNSSVLTNQHTKNTSQNISKRRKRVKTFKGKKSTEKKIPVTPSALDEFTPSETAESVTSYLTKKFSSTPGSKIKGPRLLHDPSKKKATLQKSESDTSLAPASQMLPGPISTAELSKTPSLSEIFGIEIKNNTKSAVLAADSRSAKSQVEVKGGATKEFSQVAKKRTSHVAKKKTAQVARKKTAQVARKKTAQVARKKTSLMVVEKKSQVAKKRTSGKKKGLGATQKFNSKLDVRDTTTVLKTSDRLETAASENTSKLPSSESQDATLPTSDSFESRQLATCDIKNELLQPLDDAEPSMEIVTKTGSEAETPSNLPTCTVALHKLEDLKISYELRDGVYFVKGAKSDIISVHKSKESSDQSSAVKQSARKIIKRKKKKSKVNRKQPVARQKKDIVDYYTSMLESLQKKALQLEEESRKEREEKAQKEHEEKLRKEMEEKTQKESAEETTQKSGETDGANPSDVSGIETAMTGFDCTLYDHNINEDLEEDELNEEADLIQPTDDGHLLTAKTAPAGETSKDLSFKGLGVVKENHVFPDFDIDKSDLTSGILVKNHSDDDEGKLSALADKKLHGLDDGENAGHEERANCELQEISVAVEGHKDYIYGKELLDIDVVFEKKDIVLCSSFDEEMLKMSSCERQKIASEEDMLLGQAEDFDGDDIGVIPQIEVERLLGLDTSATSPDTLDDFNLELKDQISIMEQLKDGDLMEPEMVEVGTKKQSALKNEGRFLFGASPDAKRPGSLEIKRDDPKTSDPSQSFESALRWVNIPEPSGSTSPQDTVSLVSSKPMGAEVKHTEVQNNFKVQLKFQTASLIKSIKLSKEMKNVFGEAASGGSSPTEDKKNTYEKVLSQSENSVKSLENPCSAASLASDLLLTKSSCSRPPIPKLKVRLRRETIEAIEKAKANFVSGKRGEKKQANGSKGKFVRDTDKSEVQLLEDMKFYLRSSNCQTTPPGSPVKCQGQLLHSSKKLKRGFSPRRASPRLDSRATRSKCLSPNNSPLKVTVNSNFESKQSTNEIAEGIFSSVHLFDEPLECSGSVIPAVACDTHRRSSATTKPSQSVCDINTGSSDTTKPSQSVCDINTGSSVTTKPSQSVCDINTGSSDTTKPSQSLKPLVKPLTIDIVKLKMKLNPLFSIKARQNSSKSQETELKSPSIEPKNIASPESHPSITTSLPESSTTGNQRDVVHSVSACNSEMVPGQAAFSNSSPQVVLKKLPTLNTAKLCNILKSFQKQTNNKAGQETFKGSSESTAFSNTSSVLSSSLVTKRSSPRAIRSQKSAVGVARGGRALRSSAKNVQVSSSNFVGEESKNVVENNKQSDHASNSPANPKTVIVKQLKEADDKGERSFFDCLTDVSNPSDWVDV